MKNTKKILLLLLALTLVFALVACGGGDTTCKSHVDADGDGLCDSCGKECKTEESGGDGEAKDVALITDKVANFKVVLAKDLYSDARKYVDQTLIRSLERKKVTVAKSVVDGSSDDTAQTCEILVGDISSRGDKYFVDGHSLGKEGYVIKIVDSKVIINAGSSDALVEALTEFAEDIIGIEDSSISSVTMTAKQAVDKTQKDYKVTSLKVNGTDMRGYTIAIDKTDSIYSEVAAYVQDTVYTRAGYWFNIVPLDEATDKSIVISHAANKVYGDKSFKVYTSGTKLLIDCSFDNKLEDAVATFITQKITLAKGDVEFKGDVYNTDISVVYYEDFGAKGDGKTDDFQAIYYAHEFANECGQVVKAKSGAKYYIFNTKFALEGADNETVNIATIKTNVEWGDAEFIIDDRQISIYYTDEHHEIGYKHIFQVLPDDGYEAFSVTDKATLAAIVAAGLNPTTTNIQLDVGYDGGLMIIPWNSEHKVYRRRNYGGWQGSSMHEVIVIDKDGNVSEETPIMFEYTNLDSITVYKLNEDSAITVDGGTFTTRASQCNTVRINEATGKEYSGSNYFMRGIYVSRSFTTIKNVKHYVTDEIPVSEQINSSGKVVKCGINYNGFYAASYANHVTFENCVMTGRRCYLRPEGGTTGTYDLTANEVNKIVYLNCTQSNFWVSLGSNNEITAADMDTPGAVTSMSWITNNGQQMKLHWGVGGTNFCKNMEYIGSTLSRFDAHMGLYNGKIIDSTVNYMAITGKGDFTVENTTYFAEGTGYGSNSLIHLREDYGSVWDGNVAIKNVKAYVFTEAPTYVVYHSYNNWYYGYTSAFPNISIDGITYYNISSFQECPEGFEVSLTGTQITASAKLHLTESHQSTKYAIIDADGDGFVDEPTFDHDLDGFFDDPKNYDLDNDGKYGNTSLRYDDYKDKPDDDIKKGIESNSSMANINIIKPPKYIKIVNNTKNYVFKVTDTSGKGVSDGGYYDDVENYGGFFGDTKFIYGEGAEEYFVGTNHVDQTETGTFAFR